VLRYVGEARSLLLAEYRQDEHIEVARALFAPTRPAVSRKHRANPRTERHFQPADQRAIGDHETVVEVGPR
jgi:hypothetical protein